MSFSKPSKKHSARVASKISKVMKSSSTEAKHSIKSSHHRKSSPRTPQQHPDSGFIDALDEDLFDPAVRQSSTDRDWILFADEILNYDEDYYFNENDAVDIASTKANHGSLYNGKNNENDTLIVKRSNDSRTLEVLHENPRGNDPPQQHYFSHHPTTQPGISTLQTWTHTYEQHEHLAYRFEQPPAPTHIFQDLQSWHEDIDLDFYAVPF